MSERIGLIIDDVVQGATLATVPTAVTTLPVDYLKTGLLSESMRVMGNTVTITLSFAPQEINAAVLCFHNLSSSATAAATLLDANDNVLQTIDCVIKPCLTAYFDSHQAATIQWILTDNSLDYIDVARAIAGLLWQPIFNIDEGNALKWDDPSDVVRSKGGLLHYRKRPRYRKIPVAFSNLFTDEALKLSNLALGSEFFVSFYKDWGDALEVTFEGMFMLSESPDITHIGGEFFGGTLAFIAHSNQ